MAYINFTSFVTNDEIETPTQETVKNFDCIVEVFRSEDNRKGFWGKSDETYDQNFGFDRYNQETSGKGLGATRSFKFMHFLKNSSDGIISYVYYIPWLCIWPPKASLQDFYKKNSLKKEEGKWIDPSFIPVSEAELFCRIDGGKDKKKDSGDLVFISNSEHLKVEGGKTYSLTGKSVKDEFSIKISCNGIIKNDPKNPPKIEIRETDEKGAIVGQINVVPNDEIYFGRVFFVPIEREKKEAWTENQAERRKRAKEEYGKLVQEILEYLNTKSFNQALIYFDAEASEIITFPKGLIKVGNVGEYSASVSKAYFQGIPGTDIKENQKKIKESEKELDKAIKNYYKAIKENYKNYRKEETYYLSKTMEGVDEKVMKDYKKKYENHVKILEAEILVGGHKRKEDTIYAFIDRDRNSFTDRGFEYGAYAIKGQDDAYIFNKSVENKDFGVIVHEIAHSLNLGHIFELGSDELKKKKEEEKTDEKTDNKLTEKAEKKSGETISNTAIKNNKENFDDQYDKINTRIINKSTYMAARGDKLYYKEIDDRFTQMVSCSKVEKMFLAIKDQVNKTSIQPTNVKSNNDVKEINISRSFTLENFMDYDTKPAPETSSPVVTEKKDPENEDFSYRSFNKWQWNKMKKSIFLSKQTLK